MLIGHDGTLHTEHLWSAWSEDPLVWLALAVPALLYEWSWHRSARRDERARWRRRAFLSGIAVTAVAIASPLDALSASLSSAHMAQHLLLTTVVAPLLVLGAPGRSLLPGAPPAARRLVRRWRVTPAARLGTTLLAHPVAASLPYVAALWWWHARVPYEAALDNRFVHDLEHLTFLVTALISWAAILAPARRSSAVAGTRILVLFGLAMQSGLLGVLLTFAPTPWYPTYTDTTREWGLSPLADQQLAGVLMWVPGGVTYLVVALAIVVTWIREPTRPSAVRAT